MSKHATNQRRLNKRAIAYAFVLACLLAAPLAALAAIAPDSVAEQITLFGLVQFGKASGLALAGIVFACTLILAFLAFTRLPGALERLNAVKVPAWIDIHLNRRTVLVVTLIILACWIPVLYLVFPGATKTDTVNQLYQFLSEKPTWYSATGDVIDAEFIDHHPVFDTFLLGAFAWIGRLAGSDAAGLFAYTIFQTALVAAACATAICYTERLGIHPVLRIAALVLIIVAPIFPGSAVTAQKDSLFAAFIVVYTVLFMEAIRTKGNAFASKGFLAGFIAVTCLCMLSKKTGVALMVLCGIVLICALRGKRTRAAAAVLAPLLACSLLWPAIVYPTANVAPGGSQEAWGMLYQQTVSTLKKHPEAAGDAERAAIDAVIDLDRALEKHVSWRTDEVKRCARAESTTQDRFTFLGAWAKIGLAHPSDYLMATAYCSAALLVPSTPFSLAYDIDQSTVSSFASHADKLGVSFTLDAVNPEPNQAAAKAVYGAYDALCQAPIISLFFTSGFWGGWIPLITLVATFFFRKRSSLALAPIVFSALLLIVSPAPMPRYVVSLAFLALPAIAWMLYAAQMAEPGSRKSKR